MVNGARQHTQPSTWASACADAIAPYPFTRKDAPRVDAGMNGFGLIIVSYIEEKSSWG
jgi:hypothetical protein